jgi:hypothetical protein
MLRSRNPLLLALALIVALSFIVSFDGLEREYPGYFKDVISFATNVAKEDLKSPWIQFSPPLDTRGKDGWHLRFIVLSTWHQTPSSAVRSLLEEVKQKNEWARNELQQVNRSSIATSLVSCCYPPSI